MTQALNSIGLLAVVMLTVLMSSVDQYLFVAYAIPPLIVHGLALAVLFFYLMMSVTGGHKFAVTRPQWIAFTVIYAYFFWTATSFLYAESSEIVVDVLVGRLKAAVLIIAAALVLSRQELRNTFSIACVFLVGLATALNIFDFIVPTFSEVRGRSAGFYINANLSGTALDMMPLMAAMRLPATMNFVTLGVAAVGLLLTFSRSGWIIYLLSGLGLALLGRLGSGRARFVFLGIVAALFAALLYAYWSGELYLFMSRSSMAEFLDPNTLARLGSRGVALDDYSSMERSDVAERGFEAFLEAPLLGHGVGYTYVWGDRTSTHNMLILMGAELGVPGVLLYCGLFGWMIVAARGVPRLLAMMLFADGLFTHNQLDLMNTVIPIAFVIATLGSDHPSRSAPARRMPPLPHGSARR